MGMTFVAARVPADLVPQVRADPATADAVLHGDHPGTVEQLDLDKMWEAAHVALGGRPLSEGGSLAGTIFDGEQVGSDGGYGPPLLHDPAAVARLVAALRGADEAYLRGNVDPARFAAADVYPMVWDEDPDELRDEVAGAAGDLVAFLRRAAEAGDAVVLSIA